MMFARIVVCKNEVQKYYCLQLSLARHAGIFSLTNWNARTTCRHLVAYFNNVGLAQLRLWHHSDVAPVVINPSSAGEIYHFFISGVSPTTKATRTRTYHTHKKCPVRRSIHYLLPSNSISIRDDRLSFITNKPENVCKTIPVPKIIPPSFIIG